VWPLLLLTATFGAAPPLKEAPSASLLLSEWVERIRLPAQHLSVRADLWRSELELTSELPPQTLLRAFPKGAARSCPKRVIKVHVLVLRCDSSRVQATVRGSQLELTLARGLPWKNLGAPALSWHYPPERFGLGSACPAGSTDEGRLECRIAVGATNEQVTQALQGMTGPMASLREGDLALSRNDVTSALAAYERVGRTGLIARLARVRLCEISGGCVGGSEENSTFDTNVLPEPARTELELRHVRTLTLWGQRSRAAALLNARMADRTRDDACRLWPEVCDGVITSALNEADLELQALGLEMFLRRPQSNAALRLTRQASDAAARLGAPGFAANLLASASDSAPRDELEAHLRRVIELYELARDPVRAAVVREYARTVIAHRTFGSVRALPLETEPPPASMNPQMKVLYDDVKRELELAKAVGTVSRARSVGSRVPEPTVQH